MNYTKIRPPGKVYLQNRPPIIGGARRIYIAPIYVRTSIEFRCDVAAFNVLFELLFGRISAARPWPAVPPHNVQVTTKINLRKARNMAYNM